jgi:hypothetical protein
MGHLGLHRFGFAVPRVGVHQRLPVGVADDIAAGHLVGTPWGGDSVEWSWQLKAASSRPPIQKLVQDVYATPAAIARKAADLMQ